MHNLEKLSCKAHEETKIFCKLLVDVAAATFRPNNFAATHSGVFATPRNFRQKQDSCRAFNHFQLNIAKTKSFLEDFSCKVYNLGRKNELSAIWKKKTKGNLLQLYVYKCLFLNPNLGYTFSKPNLQLQAKQNI